MSDKSIDWLGVVKYKQEKEWLDAIALSFRNVMSSRAMITVKGIAIITRSGDLADVRIDFIAGLSSSYTKQAYQVIQLTYLARDAPDLVWAKIHLNHLNRTIDDRAASIARMKQDLARAIERYEERVTESDELSKRIEGRHIRFLESNSMAWNTV